VNRGERLIKFRDSWFSTKFIEVKQYMFRQYVYGTEIVRVCTTCNYLRYFKLGSVLSIDSCQTYSDKVISRKGNSPANKLRYLSLFNEDGCYWLFLKAVGEVGLEAAIL